MIENEPKEIEQEKQPQEGETQTPSQSESKQNTLIKEQKTPPNIIPILCIAAFFLLFGDLIAATVLLITGHKIGAIVCAALFAGILISVVTVTLISAEWSLRNDIRKAKKITEGKVTRCIMANMAEYSVDVSVDGKEYTVSSKDSYEADETVMVAIFSKKRARITNDKELELLNEPLYSKAPSSHHHRHHHHH